MHIYNQMNPKVPMSERKASDDLRLRFLAALGRANKTQKVAAEELGIPVSTLSKWTSSHGHLHSACHWLVEEWIGRQPEQHYMRVKRIVQDALADSMLQTCNPGTV